MSDSHSSVLGALDAFFAVVREKADRDAEFAVALVKALKVPIEFKIEDAGAANDVLPFIDPIFEAGEGFDAFRAKFSKFKKPALVKMLKDHNLASVEEIKEAKTEAGLRDLLWVAASDRRKKLTGGGARAA